MKVIKVGTLVSRPVGLGIYRDFAVKGAEGT